MEPTTLFTELKVWLTLMIAAIAAFLSPISGDLFSMVWLFAFNAAVGLLADIVHGRKWSWRKMGGCFLQALLFFALVTFVFALGYFKNEMDSAQKAVSFVVYSLVYFYTTNIARNLCKIMPDGSVAHRACQWFYWILSVEFIKRIPYLKDYLAGKQPHEVDTPTPPNEL